jgi:hypothetical protein
MKLLVATGISQGFRPNDFNYVKDGELLVFAPQCNDANPDSACGCRRSLLGIFSRRATTTFMVKEINMTEKELLDILYRFHEEFQCVEVDELKSFAQKDFEILTQCTEPFDVGTIVERRDAYLSARIVPIGQVDEKGEDLAYSLMKKGDKK